MTTGVSRCGHVLVVVELDLLGVDEDEAHLVGRGLHQDRGEDRVDAAALARAGGAGDQHVRHLRDVGPDRVAVDPLAEPGDQRRGLLRPAGVDVAEADDAAARVRDLDADRLFARDRGQDADVGRGQRVGEVVAELGHFLDLGAGREAQLVAGDVRAADDADDLRLDPEVAERLDQLAADRVLVARIGALVGPLALLERVGGRRPVFDLLGGGDAALVALRGEGGELGGGRASSADLGRCVRPSAASSGSASSSEGVRLRSSSDADRASPQPTCPPLRVRACRVNPRRREASS